MDLAWDILKNFTPTANRFVLSALAVYIYHNIYGKISGGIIPILFFPSFYIAYIFIKYPENLNWKNKSPTIPAGGFITELNTLIHGEWKTTILFLILYISLNIFLYKKNIKSFYGKYIKGR